MYSNNLKVYREREKVTQIELAQSLGVTNDYISMIERGVRSPGFMLAKKIADFFGVTVDEIFFTNQPNKSFENDIA